jgi:hypothetical protein
MLSGQSNHEVMLKTNDGPGSLAGFARFWSQ